MRKSGLYVGTIVLLGALLLSGIWWAKSISHNSVSSPETVSTGPQAPGLGAGAQPSPEPQAKDQPATAAVPQPQADKAQQVPPQVPDTGQGGVWSAAFAIVLLTFWVTRFLQSRLATRTSRS